MVHRQTKKGAPTSLGNNNMEQNNQKTSINQLYQDASDAQAIYICSRIQGQIDYYEAKSARNKRLYHILSIIAIIANALVPICSVFLETADGSKGIKVTIAALSSFALVVTSLLTLLNARELWTKYRRSASSLTSLLHQYYTRTGLFEEMADQEAFRLLAKLSENHFDEENKTWGELLKQNEKPVGGVSR